MFSHVQFLVQMYNAGKPYLMEYIPSDGKLSTFFPSMNKI